MTEHLTLTEDTLKELQELEEVLSVLDQRACTMGAPISRAYSRMYLELLDLRDSQAADWNEDISSGQIGKAIHRCDDATTPYHTDSDGPCEVYTTNRHICDLCYELRLTALERG